LKQTVDEYKTKLAKTDERFGRLREHAEEQLAKYGDFDKYIHIIVDV
jgi:hypothetical protein